MIDAPLSLAETKRAGAKHWSSNQAQLNGQVRAENGKVFDRINGMPPAPDGSIGIP